MEATSHDDDDDNSSSSPRQLAANKPATNEGDGHQVRPYMQALQALERLTAEPTAQHHASESATPTGDDDDNDDDENDDDATLCEKEGPPSPTSSSAPVPGKCRVSFDMVRLLAGPDGMDAMGRPVGVLPGEDIEAAVLGGGEQVWVFNTTIAPLKMCRALCSYQKYNLGTHNSTYSRSITMAVLFFLYQIFRRP